jgi:integrase
VHIYVNDVCRMVNRRLKDAGLPEHLSPHSFRVTTITDLLEQCVPLEVLQRLAGHSDAHHPAVRSPRPENHAECGRADFGAIFFVESCP